jgi:1-acyl-sn-glycerol-3-phosphate acyltransferase
MTESPQSAAGQKIDIKKVFHEKNPRMARLLPGFVYAYLKRVLHQDFINDFLERHGHKKGLDFIESAFEEFNNNMVINGAENLPEQGRYMFVSNHPLGGFDGIMLIHILRQHYPSVIFLVNDILMNIPNLEEFFVPINKEGGQSRESVRILEEAYQSDSQIVSFPSGLVSRRIKGTIQDLPWQKNFIVKSRQYKRDVVPIHISGRNTNFFYRLANIRKLLRIKWNLEMFYLPDETFKHRNKTFTFTFGKSIPFATFDKTRTPFEWAAYVRELVYSLPGEQSMTLTTEK